ncbi:hypothetical protein HK101_007548 [Irineochytrium annulatum]|nr:hypothetical protein HK101_007548 [Irineochytrium annulatum]
MAEEHLEDRMAVDGAVAGDNADAQPSPDAAPAVRASTGAVIVNGNGVVQSPAPRMSSVVPATLTAPPVKTSLQMFKEKERDLKLKNCVMECKLEAALIALREAENIVPTLLAKEQYLKRKGRNNSSESADVQEGPTDMSNDLCHVCGKDGADMLVCSNEKKDKGPIQISKRGRKSAVVDEASADGERPASPATNGASKPPCKNVVCNYDADEEEEAEDDNEETCAICKSHGELVCCDGCPAVFHLKCLNVESLPDTEWFCETCVKIQAEIKDNPPWRSHPTVLSLFDGIGAAYVALRRLGVTPAIYLSSEIDQPACDVLDAYADSHHGHVVQLGDVRRFTAKKDLPKLLQHLDGDEVAPLQRWDDGLPVVDLMIGGSPCTDLSFLGQGAGVVEGTNSSFFFEYVRILREVRPRWFVFENVRMRKSDMDIISKELGVQPTPVGTIHMINRKRLTHEDSVDLSPCRRNRLFWTNIPIRKIPTSLSDRPMLASEIVLDEAIPELAKANCITRGNSSPHVADSRFNVLWYADGKRRSYHPVELERLMGFPDFYTEAETSRIQRHGMVGNSFSVYSVAHILGSLFKGDEKAPELEWRPKNSQSTATTAGEEEQIILPPLPEVPSRVTVGQREKIRRVLRRLQKMAQHISVVDVPSAEKMAGSKLTDYDHRYPVLVNDAGPKDPPSWSAAILVPLQEMDSTMPQLNKKRDRKIPSYVVRYFSNAAYGIITGANNFRLLDGNADVEPGATMARCLPGWATRKDVVKALAYASGAKAPVAMRWAKWGADREPKMPRGEKRKSSTVKPPGKAAYVPSEIPTLASIAGRFELSIPEIPPPNPDGSHVVGSVVPEGGYSTIQEVEDDFRAAVEAIMKASPELGPAVKEAFEKEWANNDESWLSEGSPIFVVPHKFMKVKDNQVWWPGMIVPLEEIDNSFTVKATGAGSYVALVPFDHDLPDGNFANLCKRFGEQAVKNHTSIRKALRYVTTGICPPGFPWPLWGSSGLYRTGGAIQNKRKRMSEINGDGGGDVKRLKSSDESVDGNGDVTLGYKVDEHGNFRRCKDCGVTDTVCWRNGTTGPKTLCNDCGLKLYVATVPRVPVSDLSNERFTENLDKSKNNSEHRYYSTRRPLPFKVWDRLGGGMLDSNFRLREGFTLPPEDGLEGAEVDLNPQYSTTTPSCIVPVKLGEHMGVVAHADADMADAADENNRVAVPADIVVA